MVQDGECHPGGDRSGAGWVRGDVEGPVSWIGLGGAGAERLPQVGDQHS